MRTGPVYRSNKLSGLTDADLRRVADLGVTLDVDLRNGIERYQEPDRIPAGSWLRAAFAEVDHLYGSMDAYARQGLGLDDATIDALRARLLV